MPKLKSDLPGKKSVILLPGYHPDNCNRNYACPASDEQHDRNHSYWIIWEREITVNGIFR